MLDDPEFIRSMSDEVHECLFSGPMRHCLKMSLAAVMMARLEAHGKAMAAMEAVRGELAQPWRIQQGGKDGGPTKTEDLIGMMKVLTAEARQGEELFQKSARLFLEELRANPLGAFAEEHRFSGREAVVQVPPTSTASEREAVRNFIASVVDGVSEVTPLIEVKAQAADITPGHRDDDVEQAIIAPSLQPSAPQPPPRPVDDHPSLDDC